MSIDIKNQLCIKDIQHVSLSILKSITKECEEQGLRYSLAFGTLIGAIRHKGFIPWDDDVDIMMPRPDYERLLKYLAIHPIKNLKVFNHKTTSNYLYGITRICDTRYRIIEEGRVDCGMGVFVDIYPLDGLADDYKDAKKEIMKNDGDRDIVCQLIWENSRKLFVSWGLKASVQHFFNTLVRRFHGTQYYLSRMEQRSMSKLFNSYKYVGVPNWNWTRCVFQRSWFDKFVKVHFEDGDFYAVSAYAEMLREEYGDYMQLPPMEQRVYHHCYKAYKV